MKSRFLLTYEFSKDLQQLFIRDLDKLQSEVNHYKDEELLWIKSGEIKNSAGNLAMHICGNLQHFLGATLLGTSYKRDRPFEFEGRMTRDEITEEIAKTKSMINTLFESSSAALFEEVYPANLFGYEMSVFHFIVHLQGHLNYHLGQINYHRRLLG